MRVFASVSSRIGGFVCALILLSLSSTPTTPFCAPLRVRSQKSGENLVALSGRPDCALVVFRWQKGKAEYCVSLAADLATPPPTTYDLFTQLCLNPLDSETCAVWGPRGLQFYRLAEDQALPMRGLTDQLTGSAAAGSGSAHGGGGGGSATASGLAEVTCAAWLKEPADTVVAGSSAGRLALYTQGVFQAFVAPCLPLGVAATALVPLACGVVVGGADGGLRFLKLSLPELGEALTVRAQGGLTRPHRTMRTLPLHTPKRRKSHSRHPFTKSKQDRVTQ